MIDQAVPQTSTQDVEAVLRDELARGDAMVDTVLPVLRHLIAGQANSVFSDEILARVRGMMRDIAAALLDALAMADGKGERHQYQPADIEVLTSAFSDNPQLLTHLHAQALEWQLTERLQVRLSLDPVVSSLLQSLVSASDPAAQQLAMHFVAAQARWCQSQRRMKLPINELPGDLFHNVLVTLRALAGAGEDVARRIALAEEHLRAGYDEGANRLGLASRLLHSLGGGAQTALYVEQAGAALFLSALGFGSGQMRDLVVLSTHEAQLARLALSLRSAGLKPAAVEQQFLALHPEVTLPEGFERLGPDNAAAILGSGRYSA